MDGDGELGRRYPAIVRRVNKDCAGLRVTRYSMYWNLAFWLLREASEGRTFGGEVLEISGQSFLRPYLQRPGTRFTQADYPAVDVLALDAAYAPHSFDFVILDNVLEHVANPLLAVWQCGRVLRPGGSVAIIAPSTNPYHFGPHDFWRFSPDALKVLAAPFSAVRLCGSFRSSGVAALLAEDYPKGTRASPTGNARARAMALERPRKTSATRPQGGWAADAAHPSGDPKYGEMMITSWVIATK